MGDKSAIEWTDATWNPVTGCTKVGPGCDHCYAERIAERFRGTPGHPFERGFDLTLRPERLEQPLRWKKPRRIFVNSMSDLFHKDIPTGYIDRVFSVMEQADRHTFQVLTKRSTLMRKYVNDRWRNRPPPRHIWLGVTVEDITRIDRIRHLRETPAAVRFLSLEPLLSSMIGVHFNGMDWIIVGGESGPGARPMEPEWVRRIRGDCILYDRAFLFKQWGGLRPKSNGRILDGRVWDQYPVAG